MVWNAQGHWVMPGFISAHSHLWQSAYRGLASDQTLLGWIAALYGKAVTQASAEDFYWFTLEGGLDHLRHGITATYSFNYGGHSRDQSEEFNEKRFVARLTQVCGLCMAGSREVWARVYERDCGP